MALHITSAKQTIRSQVEKMGWRCLDDRLWDNLEDFKEGVVILAPPLDTIPSPNGNAIYTIVQELAERAPVPCLVLAVWPQSGEPARCSISDRILYCEKPFRPVLFEKVIPYRIKKMLWGTGRPEMLHYAYQAARLCRLLEIKTVVIEDSPRYGSFFRKIKDSSTKIFLHQHNNSPLSHTRQWWNKIQSAFDGFIFVAQKNLSETQKKHGKLHNSKVIFNGVDLQLFNPERVREKAVFLRNENEIKANEIVLLYVGRIIPGKGCLQLIKAFLAANVPDTRLVMIGDVQNSLFNDLNYNNNIQELVESSCGRVFLPGVVPQIDIPAWYQAADLVVVPSIQSEGLPKVITEALAMGKTVLTSNRGGSLELVKAGKNGWAIKNPENIEEFSEQIRNICTDRDCIEKFSKFVVTFNRPLLDISNSSKDFFAFVLGHDER